MGSQPFATVSGRNGNHQLRQLLYLLGVADASKYRSHDLRRGHAKDLMEAGSPWEEILEKGDWSSQATPRRAYLPEELVEARASGQLFRFAPACCIGRQAREVMEARLIDSSDGELDVEASMQVGGQRRSCT